VEYIGEIDKTHKDEFLGNVFAYLFPINWPEPFGMTMIEAMACGAPVIAMNLGSVPEVSWSTARWDSSVARRRR